MIATPSPGFRPALAPGVGDRVRALVELAVGELAALVDHRHAVAVADRPDGDRAAEHPVALERQRHLREPVRRLEPDDAAADAERGEVRLVTRAFGEFQRTLDYLPRVQLHDLAYLSFVGHLTHFRFRRGASGSTSGMLGELVTLPLRVGARATQLWLRAAEQTVAVVADTAGRLIDIAVPRQSAMPGAQPAAGSRPKRTPATSETTTQLPMPSAPASASIPEAAPTHVSEEPELVAEIAEPGAEDGAGPELHVREPWVGYERMKADEVIDRLTGSNAAELAAIELYENEHKRRAMVLQTVERELRLSTGSGTQSKERSR